MTDPKPEPRNTIYLDLGADLLFALLDVAKAQGKTINQLVVEVLRHEFTGDKIERLAAAEEGEE